MLLIRFSTITMPSSPTRHSRRNPTAAVIWSQEVRPHLTRRRRVSANLPIRAASALVMTGGVSMMIDVIGLPRFLDQRFKPAGMEQELEIVAARGRR